MKTSNRVDGWTGENILECTCFVSFTFKQVVLLFTTFVNLDFGLSNQNMTDNKLYFSERILLSRWHGWTLLPVTTVGSFHTEPVYILVYIYSHLYKTLKINFNIRTPFLCFLRNNCLVGLPFVNVSRSYNPACCMSNSVDGKSCSQFSRSSS